MHRLKELRTLWALTLRELGQKSGVSYATIWRLENGHPGEARTVQTANVTVTGARWLPDGRQLLIVGTEPDKGLRAYLTDRKAARGCGTPRQVLDKLILGRAHRY